MGEVSGKELQLTTLRKPSLPFGIYPALYHGGVHPRLPIQSVRNFFCLSELQTQAPIQGSITKSKEHR